MMLKAECIHKSYFQGVSKIHVLKGLNLRVSAGDTVAIVGPSGGGKSTLLSLLCGIDSPDEGELYIQDENVTHFSQDQWSDFRAKNIGFVFQQFHLISHLTALENVMVPLDILGQHDLTIAKKSLVEVGLEKRFHHFPSELSGGEIQRVAIARALVGKPKMLFADEPSGNLDQNTGDDVMKLLFNLVRDHGSTLILVTHSASLAKQCKTVYELSDGLLKIAP
ncbi:MAG: ABC transporter ATP-binding protein [Bdellovibrionales bacterium]|nr:ABC transporter ATP-binding protein [Bdellovibrionales bacterium]MCB0309081.1 ABC transporter ATP-binding protein [Bdellovibrionales bacterium]